MKNSTFQCSRSMNHQLHNKISQEEEYECYLKRVRKIVGKKPRFDDSPRIYMTNLHRWKDSSSEYRKGRVLNKQKIENQALLSKITQKKERKFPHLGHTYFLAIHEKRNREMERISHENKRIANKITQEESVLTRFQLINKTQHSPKRDLRKLTHMGWNCSPLKDRELPILGPFYPDKENM